MHRVQRVPESRSMPPSESAARMRTQRARARVELRGLERSFGSVKALDGFSLEIRPGELVALLGPSGSGKTTVLRVLAGLEEVDRGHVLLDGVEITHLPAFRREMGMVFQAYSLFPNMTALGNVSFGLKLRGVGRLERSKRASELLELAGLAAEAGRYPHQLSGGQQQRVALARALAIEPRVLLLDEPLSALDARVRSQLRDEIRRVQQEVGITTLFVTHDQEEALSIADRVGVMRSGLLEQVGSPSEIYERPATAFVAEFVGSVNRLPGVVAENLRVRVLGTLLMPLEASSQGMAPGSPGRAGDSVVGESDARSAGRATGSGDPGPSVAAVPQWTVGMPVDVLVRAEAVRVVSEPEGSPAMQGAGANAAVAAEISQGRRGRDPTRPASPAGDDGAEMDGCEGHITSRAFLGPVVRLGIVVHQDERVPGEADGLVGADVSGPPGGLHRSGGGSAGPDTLPTTGDSRPAASGTSSSTAPGTSSSTGTSSDGGGAPSGSSGPAPGAFGEVVATDPRSEHAVVAMVPAGHSGPMVPGSRVRISFVGSPLFVTARAEERRPHDGAP